MDKERKQRTNRQNRSLHKLMGEVAGELNDSGLYMQMVLKHNAEIWWTPEMAKDYLLRPFIRAMYGVESTTELDTKQIGDAMNAMCDHLAKTTGKSFEIPSIEAILNSERIKEGK